jgi:hypothetical protein
MNIHVGSGFHPWDTLNSSNRGNSYSNRLAGSGFFDIPYDFATSGVYFANNTNQMGNYYQTSTTYASSTSYQLDLNIFRSGIDPNFAVISFRHPTISSLKLRDNTFTTFFVHNFTTSVWDLEHLFLGGLTEIIPYPAEDSYVNLEFRTHIIGETFFSGGSRYPSKRCAEFGYSTFTGTYANNLISTYYTSVNAPLNSFPYSNACIYTRNNAITSNRGNNSYNTQYLSSSTNFNAVIRGIPLNPNIIPCPYYIPDDFVLIDFDYATPSTNIQQGDTVTISESEVYTVITGSYNQNTRTRGILFCARTV